MPDQAILSSLYSCQTEQNSNIRKWITRIDTKASVWCKNSASAVIIYLFSTANDNNALRA